MPLIEHAGFSSADLLRGSSPRAEALQSHVMREVTQFCANRFHVDTQGNWWFLEINEQGQFLWLDQFNPNIKMQDKFCAFVTAPEGSTQPLEDREGLFPPFGEYVKIYDEQQAKQETPDLGAVAASSPYMSQEP